MHSIIAKKDLIRKIISVIRSSDIDFAPFAPKAEKCFAAEVIKLFELRNFGTKEEEVSH